MGYADRDDDLYDYDPGVEGTRGFPAMGQPPGERTRVIPAWPLQDSWPSQGSWPPASHPRVIGPGKDHGERERPSRQRSSRMRPDRWVMAIGSITGAVAVYVALTATGTPARPMPSPFAPATAQGAPAHPAPNSPVTCVTARP
jgi:hypothetical protein